MSLAYHPQMNSQIKVVNRILETYLRCMVGERPKDWSKWIPLAEWWYNTTFHSTTQTIPYEVVYKQPTPIYLPNLLGDSNVDVLRPDPKGRHVATAVCP